MNLAELCSSFALPIFLFLVTTFHIKAFVNAGSDNLEVTDHIPNGNEHYWSKKLHHGDCEYEARGIGDAEHVEEAERVDKYPDDEGNGKVHTEEVVASRMDVHLLLLQLDAGADLEKLTDDVIQVVENK